MTLGAALRLGRVSNLPTVWSNALAGFALSGTLPEPRVTAGVMAALSLMYVAGMYLNDAFDRDVDAVERPHRPIPAGQAGAAAVFAAGFGMMAAGLALLGWLAVAGAPWLMPVVGTALAATILLYDVDHKDNPWSPAVMGLCRALAVIVAATAAAPVGPLLLPAVVGLFCHVVGLTYAARHEASGRLGPPWPLLVLAAPVAVALWLALDAPAALVLVLALAGWSVQSVLVLRRGGAQVPRGVAALIAGIALYDAAVVTALAGPALGGMAAAGFVLTLALQRHVPGS